MTTEIDDKRREKVRRSLAVWVSEGGGEDEKIEDFRTRFPDIPRRTFYRWLKQARLVAGSEAQSRTMQRVRELAAQEAPTKAAAAVGDLLPAPVTPDSIMPFNNLNALGIIRSSIQHAESVIDTCYSEAGKVRNGKLLLSAASNLIRSVETLTRVAERMNNVAKIEEMQNAMIEEVAKESPETSIRILRRIQELITRYGF
jgi:hypothetical protein